MISKLLWNTVLTAVICLGPQAVTSFAPPSIPSSVNFLNPRFTKNAPSSIGSLSSPSRRSPFMTPLVLSAVSEKHQQFFQKATSVFVASFLLLSNIAPLPAAAFDGGTVVGEIKGSGLIFKDTLVIESFNDPKIQGVTLYISNFQRPLTERLQKDFFSDPSFASVSCAKTTSEVKVADTIAMGKGGEEVFEESKSLLFKTLRVQRIYDKETNTVVYVSFNTRLDKNSDDNKSRFKSSTCAVNLN